MAGKKSKIMGTAAGATIRQFTFEQSGTGGTAYYYDVAKMLSSFNQRLYRQGMTYLVQVEQLYMTEGASAAPGSGQYNQVNSLPNCWQVRKAWAKGFKMYRAQIAAIVGRAGARSDKARFNDFKIGYEHGTSWSGYIGVPGGGANVEPTGAVFTYGDGEWDKSFITNLETNTRFTADMFGTLSAGAEYGLLAMYNTEPGVQGPDPPESGATPNVYQPWVTDDDIPGTVVEDWTEQGDEPPYNPDVLQVVATQNLISANGLMANSTPWTEVPCGLLKIVTNTDASLGNNWITIRVAPGSYKGVCAESMIAKVN